MKKILAVASALVVSIAGLILVRTLMFTPGVSNSETLVSIPVDEKLVTANMSEAIRFKTVSVAVEQIPDYGPFSDFVSGVKAT